MRKLELYGEEMMVFDVYLAGIVSMNLHPGIGRSNGVADAPPKMDLDQCFDLALEMIELRRQVMTYREPGKPLSTD